MHELKLSTVEKNDPQMIKKVFLEQQACAPTRDPLMTDLSDVSVKEQVQKTKSWFVSGSLTRCFLQRRRRM